MAILALGQRHVHDVRSSSQHHGTVPTAVGAAMEGTEQRFGVAELGDLRRRDHADLHRRGGLVPRLLHRLGGMITMFNMMLGEVAPGGAGSGLYGMLSSR